MSEKNRIPASDSRQFPNWHLPEVTAGHVVEAEPGRGNRDPGSEIVARALTARQLEEITAQAQREGHQQGFAEGRAEGVQKGLQEGRAAARAELQQQIAQLQMLMKQLLQPIAEQQDAIEMAMARLSLDVARAVIGREAALPAEQLLPIVRAAVRELPVGERNITVLLHPQQLELIGDGDASWPPTWKLQADSRIDRGGCRVLGEHSLVDYTIELRFRQVAERLLAVHADSAPPEPGSLLDNGDD